MHPFSLGTQPEIIKMSPVIKMIEIMNGKNPFGDGKAGKRIVEIVEGVQG